MVNLADTHGKRIAMIAWGTTSDGSDDVAVFTGIAEWDGTTLTMIREPRESSLLLHEEWLEQLKPVTDDVKGILLDAEYFFSLSIGNIDEADEMYARLGLQWPTE